MRLLWKPVAFLSLEDFKDKLEKHLSGLVRYS